MPSYQLVDYRNYTKMGICKELKRGKLRYDLVKLTLTIRFRTSPGKFPSVSDLTTFWSF